MKKNPFIRTDNDTYKIYKNIFVSLIPLILFIIYKSRLKAIPNLLIGPFLSLLIEYLYFKFYKKEENYKDSILRSHPILFGTILSLIIPYKAPIYLLVIAILLSSLFKYITGGYENIKINPILVGYLLVYVFFKDYGIVKVNIDANLFEIFAYGTDIPVLLCILSYIFLYHKKCIKFKIPLISTLTYIFLVTIIGLINNYGINYIFYNILNYNIIFFYIFIESDYITSPITNIGQIFYSIIVSILSIWFLYLTNLPIVLSILICNLLVPLLDKIGYFSIKTYKRLIFPLILIILLSVTSCIKIGEDIKHEKYEINYERIK